MVLDDEMIVPDRAAPLNPDVIPRVLGVFTQAMTGREVPVFVFVRVSTSTRGRASLCGAVDVAAAVQRASNDWHVTDPDGWHDGHRLAPVRAKCGTCDHVDSAPSLAIRRRSAVMAREMSAKIREVEEAYRG